MNRVRPESRLSPRAWAAVETALIFLLFFLYAGWPAPEVNEAHYLAKAKHYWNPAWCAGDHFLESADAHLVFYWVFGWVTLFLSLPAAAWVGRIVTWLALAWSWQRLSTALAPLQMLSVLTAGMFLTAQHHGQMAGEWIAGGVEAKGFAYVFVFLSLAALARGGWRTSLLLLGPATSLHVLAGGWSLVALAIAWLLAGKERPAVLNMFPAAVGAVLLALPGLIPAVLLTSSAEPEVIGQANQIYVFGRLSHHLLISALEPERIVRHVAFLMVWIGLAWSLRKESEQKRFQLFVAGAVAIAAAGAILEFALAASPLWTAGLMKYYWFRLSDIMVPAGVALAIGAWIVRLHQPRPQASALLVLAAVALAGLALGVVYFQRMSDLRPAADQQSLASARDPSGSRGVLEDWRKTCRWIAENTPEDARFITPRRQQTFKWYAGRSEVASWKDVPQDAESLLQWQVRQQELYPRQVLKEGLIVLGEDQLRQLAEKYHAQYVILDKNSSLGELPWPQVYPLFGEQNRSYVVYFVPPKFVEKP